MSVYINPVTNQPYLLIGQVISPHVAVGRTLTVVNAEGVEVNYNEQNQLIQTQIASLQSQNQLLSSELQKIKTILYNLTKIQV
jgi:chaperonin cofactor prefoldin